jgi:hypothetical protein
MLMQLVLLESQRLVPKSMCENYRNRVASVKPAKVKTPRLRVSRQQQIIQ